MKPHDLIFAAALALIAVFALSPAVSASDLDVAADDATAAGVSIAANSVIFNDFEVNDPTCVCSADPYVLLGPDEETCAAS